MLIILLFSYIEKNLKKKKLIVVMMVLLLMMMMMMMAIVTPARCGVSCVCCVFQVARPAS